MQRLRSSAAGYLVVVAVLAAALWYGRTRAEPDLTIFARDIFPQAVQFSLSGGIISAADQAGDIVGWIGSGSTSGYGGPMLVVVGIDPAGNVAGARVVEQRETPIFWRIVRASDYLGSLVGARFEAIEYDYGEVVGLTGATISSDAIVAGVKSSVARVAQEAFNVGLVTPRLPFEFGVLEVTVLALFAVAVVVQRSGGTLRRRARWAMQIVGLIVLGFWKDSPITLLGIKFEVQH